MSEDLHNKHFEKFSEHEKEIAGLKTNVGIIQADVQTLQTSMSAGFSNIQAMLTNSSNAPAKISGPMLFGLFSVGAMLVGALWVTVLLLVTPVSQATVSNREYVREKASESDAQSSRRHEEQDYKIEESKASIEAITQQLLKYAETRGEFRKEIEWLRDDVKDLDGTRDTHRGEIKALYGKLRHQSASIENYEDKQNNK